MVTVLTIILFVLLVMVISYYLHEWFDWYLPLPEKTEWLSFYIAIFILAIIIWNQFDNFEDMSILYLIGFSIGTSIGVDIVSFFLAILLGTFLKLKDKLD